MKPSHEGTRYWIERVFDRVIGIMSMGLISPAAVALVAWVLVMAVYIVGRTFFNLGWLFVEEFTAYLMVLVSFLALPYTLRSEGHIRADVVTRLLPKRVRDILEVVTILLSLVIVGYLTQKGTLCFWTMVESEARSTFSSTVLLWPVYLLIPIGLVALGLALLLQLYRSVIRLVESGTKS